MAEETTRPSGLQPSRPFHVVEGQEGHTGKKVPTSYLTTLINLAKGYVGTGVYSLGLAFKNSGMLLGPSMLIILALASLHCQHLLMHALERIAAKEPQVVVKPDFGETVRYSFQDSGSGFIKRHARFFEGLTNVFLCIAQLGICCVYLIFAAEHFKEIAHSNTWKGANVFMLLAIVVIPVLLSTWIVNLQWLMPLCLFSNILVWVGIIMILYYTVQGLPPIGDHDLVSSYKKQPLAFGTAIFAFQAVCFITPLRNEMRKPSQFISKAGVLNVGLAFVVTLYFAIGFMSYWRYGADVKGSVFLNLPQNETLSQVIKGMIGCAVAFSYPFQFYVPFEIIYTLFHLRYGPFKRPFIVMTACKSILVIMTYALANGIPKLGLFISLVGSMAGAFLALILPPFLDIIAVAKGERGVFMMTKNIALMVLGTIGGITGTVLSIYDIVMEFVND